MDTVDLSSDSVCHVALPAEEMLRRHGKTFAFASAFLSPLHRRRAAALYGFCRYVDDLADEATNPAQNRGALISLWQALAERQPRSNISNAMLELMAETCMPDEPVISLLQGMISDLGKVRIATEEELIHYSYQVAGTVGVMMCHVLDADIEAARPFAINLGIGMQLTNIARDVMEDAANDRRYLPSDWVGDLTPKEILANNSQHQGLLSHGVKRLLTLAEQYYERAHEGLIYLPWRARLAIFLASRLYRHIGIKIANNNGYRPSLERAHLTKWDKIFWGTKYLLLEAGPLLREPVSLPTPTATFLPGQRSEIL
jgi:15-cis-phytoene synthase